MTSYEYTEVSRLDFPHNYMYSPYLGEELITAYFSDRSNILSLIQLNQVHSEYDNLDLYFYFEAKLILLKLFSKVGFEMNDDLNEPTQFINKAFKLKSLKSFNINECIDTEVLLSSIIFSQIKFKEKKLTKEWMDRIIKKFEVTKKLFNEYPSNFQRGEGSANNIRLYWLLALSLSLYYANTKNLKYLSSLMKLSDLICSLEFDYLKDKLMMPGLALILNVEMFYIKLLSRKIKGVNIDFN